MSNEINYEIDNCITDLDTLKVLDKRAIKNLENNAHKIEQQEVLTIIREFIRLRNDYNKEREKNKKYENKIKAVLELIDTKPYTAYTLYGDILYDDENIRELLEERN